MNAEKQSQQMPSRVIQNKDNDRGRPMADNRPDAAVQAKMVEVMQRQSPDDEELLQGKFALQRQEDEDELLQGKFVAQMQDDDDELLQEKPAVQQQAENRTGIPDQVKQRMEDSFGTDFSSVRIHPDSSKAPGVGALAYTQGTDIHFAPGQFKPDTSAGQQLLGHELTHVVQQAEGRVQPTREIGGMQVNDDHSLEHEADTRGAQAAAN